MTAPHQRRARSGNDLRILRAAVFAAVCVVLAAAGHTLASCATVPLWTLGAGFLGAFLVAAPLAGRTRSLTGTAALLAAGQTVLHTLFGLGQHAAAAPGTGSSMSSMRWMSSMQPMADASLVERAARFVCGTTAAAISPAQARRILADARLSPDTAMDMGSVHHPADALSTTGSVSSLLPSLPMLLSHVLAAIAAGWLLRRGDLALLRLAELSTLSAQSITDGALVRSLRAALALVRALRAGLPAAPEEGPRPPHTALLAPPKPRTTALQHTVIRRGPPAAALDIDLAA
ncbi:MULTISPECIES: hypothetical protein [unclassified Streptomyces]|uniref:hypothetical protein n=1 Tax=unclassified Streptomyces TaxID=2593676 RepID=UPI00225ABE4C|nr:MULTISPECIES: hypothetical protein [unclassified Streptomyces]MCX4882021.1 hypothetical protein [Streptomyces sp. NBC_00847]MCX5422050.1 hypothetical protein [Streptomyces sp. NBC_00078]